MANNSQIAIEKASLSLDEPVDRTEQLRETEANLVRIIEAISRIKESAEWSTLTSLVFSKRVGQLETQLLSESEKETINDSNIYRLQGRLFEARKYDLDKLAESKRLELTHIRKLIPPTER